MVFRARCCSPIRGEKIVGYITRGKGVSVHSATCPNVVNLLYDPERRIEVEWDKSDARRALHRQADDGGRGSQGDAGGGQRQDRRHQHQHQEHGSAHRRRQHARIDVTIEISDLKHLEKVIKSLRGVDGVLGVERAGARLVTPAVAGYPLVEAGDQVDFDPRVLRQARHLDGRARPGTAPRSTCRRSRSSPRSRSCRRGTPSCGRRRRRSGRRPSAPRRDSRRRDASARRCPPRRSGRSRDRAAPAPRRTAAARRERPGSTGQSLSARRGCETACFTAPPY